MPSENASCACRDVAVFVGPSLDIETARSICDGMYLPPARCGDVIQLKQLRPKVVVLIDGEFEHTAAVWHKEILDVLESGVSVIGSSSIGALRAAELHTFGMIGVGEVFRRYRDGEILDDDEVALQYICAPWGYTALSEPLVNIRIMMERAEAAGDISSAQARRVLENAKRLFFHDRTWDRVLGATSGACLRERLLTNHYVDQKREDAMAALSLASTLLARHPQPKPRISVQPSVFLRKLRGDAVCRAPSPDQAPLGLDLSFASTSAVDSCVFLYERLAVMLANVACLLPRELDQNLRSQRPGHRVLTLAYSMPFRAATVPRRLQRFRRYALMLFEGSLSETVLRDPRHARALDLLVLLWSLVDSTAHKRGFIAEGERLERLADDFRKSRQLEKAADTRRWLREHRLMPAGFVEFLRAQDRIMLLCDSFNMQLLGIGEQLDDSVYWLEEAIALACADRH